MSHQICGPTHGMAQVDWLTALCSARYTRHLLILELSFSILSCFCLVLCCSTQPGGLYLRELEVGRQQLLC